MEKITIVDDDIELAETIAMVLKKEGYDVEIVDNLGDGRTAIRERRPDLVILDVMFPENLAGGFDLAREIRTASDTKDLPVILLTAVNQEFPMDFSSGDIDENWIPVQDFIEKPPTIPDLLDKIKQLIADRSA